ncbi:hypothetical protein [Azospirillum argentinense]|uniref:Uncharacterized protein n=1 Tax=Azospirillum argentinense TaxID=2970906 RepID=A0A5B0KSH4_9PROT|nr:hypothetical protein [Azospirillum argentinense]KAA1053744.1 hypothetical protein FH063_002326 [Azospirillum argentinense]
MPLRPEYTLHQSDLNEFLSAPLWDEENGSRLSVLSALARLGIDPWAEAARLAALPKDAAASALAVILRRLPAQQPEAPDAVATADRLVKLLPEGGSATAPNGEVVDRSRRTGIVNPWFFLLLMAALVAWGMMSFWS